MKKWILIVIIVAVLLVGTIGAVTVVTFDLIDFGEEKSGGGGTPLKNPTEGLTDDEAVAKFDENFVYYILVSIGARDLHNPPFSSDTPKINFYVGEDVYNAEVDDGRIEVAKGEVSEADITIRTSKLEAVKMTRNRNYVVESFSNGGSEIELVASKTKLASKGYLGMYEKFS